MDILNKAQQLIHDARSEEVRMNINDCLEEVNKRLEKIGKRPISKEEMAVTVSVLSVKGMLKNDGQDIWPTRVKRT